jgi:hypothetical protein
MQQYIPFFRWGLNCRLLLSVGRLVVGRELDANEVEGNITLQLHPRCLQQLSGSL